MAIKTPQSSTIVSTRWLFENLSDPNLIILDASQVKNINDQIAKKTDLRIPGTHTFDLKSTFSDKENKLPAMLPSPEVFQEECRKIGIQKHSKIIVYDNLGIYFSPRVWWMFKAMGHDDVSVLNGGLPQWSKDGYDLTSRRNEVPMHGNFVSQMHDAYVVPMRDVFDNITHKKATLIDARSAGRFNGTQPEPRKDLSSGHIPGSINIPYTNVLTSTCYKPEGELKVLFAKEGLENKPLIFSCGSGVTACIVLLAAEMVLGCPTVLYDGSWTEWSQAPEMPIEKASKA